MQKLFLLLYLSCFSLNAQTYLLKKVDSLLYLGDYKSALNYLDNKNYKTFDVFNKAGNIYQQIGDYSKAIYFYEKALSLKSSQKTKENLGKSYQKNNKSSKAILLFEEILKENSNHLLLKYHLAKLYKSKRNFKKAKKLFNDIINFDTTNPNYYYYLGSTYLSLKDKDSAKIQFLNAIMVDSTYFKGLYNLAKIYRKKDNKYLRILKRKVNNDTSFYYLKQGLLFYPKSNSLNQLAAHYYFIDNEYLKTINYLTNLETLNKENKQTLAICYYYTKNYEMAKDYLYNLIDNNNATSTTFFYLALVYKAEKDYEKAEMYMQRSISAEKPQLTEFYFQLGLIHQKYNKLQKAIADFKMALKENKHNHKAHYQLALTCDSFYKDKNIALSYYKSYIKKFSLRDKKTTLFVKLRIKEITKKIFYKG